MGVVHAKEKEPQSKLHAHDTGNENYETDSSAPTSLEGIAARVDRIKIDGLARTKDDIIQDAVRDLFSATDFQDVLVKAHRVRKKLDTLGCFKNIAIFIDTSKGPNSTPDGLEVTYQVKEHRALTGGITTQVGNNEGSLIIGLRAPNIFGRGERVQMEYSYGSKRSNNFNVAYIKPFRGTHNPIFTTSVYQATSEWPSSGYKQLDRGVILDLGFNSLPLFKHNLQWDACIRDLSVLSRSSPFEVREQSGLTLKSALRHIFSIDVRDDLIFPSYGGLFQLTTEVAGIGGNVGFLKNGVFIQQNYSLIDDFVLQAAFAGGIMKGISNDMKLSMSDMYYLGGPLTLRGFQMRGVGPQSESNALGSTLYWSCGLHLFTPLPFRPGKGGFGELFRTHLFVNAGNVGDYKNSDANLIEQLGTNVRVAYGIGIALRLGNMARIEVNYCFPYRFERTDRVQSGVQFGVGVQFL